MSSKSNRLRAVRKRLLREWPICFWCRRFLIDQDEDGDEEKATLDHLNSRNRPGIVRQRLILPPEEMEIAKHYVLACSWCNNERGKQEQKKLGREELQRRSKLHRRK